MSRQLVVESEARPRVSNVDQASIERDPTNRGCRATGLKTSCRSICRLQRIGREYVLDVRQDQLLVLLLMVDPKLDDECEIFHLPLGAVGEKALHPTIDVASVVEHLVHRRPRESSPLRLRVAIAGTVIVRIENVGVASIDRGIARQPSAQYEGFKEPAGVGQVPFGRADFGHRLNHEVFCFERLTQSLRTMPDREKGISQRMALHFVAFSHSGLLRLAADIRWLGRCGSN